MTINPVVLHVDDDPNDAILIGRAIRKLDYSVRLEWADDGEKALEYLEGSGAYSDRARYPLPQLILLDLKLPRKSGFEVLTWIRAQPHIRRIPVVMLSSSKQPLDVNRALDLGANAFVTKPFDFEAIAASIKTMFTFWLEMAERPSGDAEV